jgi:CBS-domain-containing membrane protein
MEHERASLKPIEGAARPARQRLPLRDEFALALLPTLVVLAVFSLVELLSRQRLLFASLASSAFLIYLDPQHGTNRVRTLVLSQMLAAVVGFAALFLVGREHPYLAGGAAMVVTIALMVVLDAVHPPAVSTSLAFAFRAGDETSVIIFALAVGITALLVGIQRAAVWSLAGSVRRAGGGGRTDAR